MQTTAAHEMTGGGVPVKQSISKVMKYELHYENGFEDFHSMQTAVWDLQKQTCEILNKTIQIACNWDFRDREHYKATGEHLEIKKIENCTFDTYVYRCLKDSCREMGRANLNATLRKALQKYKSDKKKILSGEVSIPSYRSNQPIVMHKDCVKLRGDSRAAYVDLTLFSDEYKKEYGLTSNLRFSIKMHDNTQRSIYDNCINGAYVVGSSQLVYDRRKWFLLLTYSFSPQEHGLDPEKILGVDLGEAYAIYASSIYGYGTMKIEGGEITAYASKLEKRKKSLQKQAVYCGEGRIGHGVKTRTADAYKAGEKIANFRDTINHRYSKALIEYAVKNGYGTIQMENLTKIKENSGFPKRLQHWTYYDLQTKIVSKASEHGIEVRLIDPRYTSQRCSKCGMIDEKNRTSQERFCCISCGYTCNADFNASQNISTKDIEQIIKKFKDANPK